MADEIIYEVQITDKDVTDMPKEQVKQLKHDLTAAVLDVLWTYRMIN